VYDCIDIILFVSVREKDAKLDDWVTQNTQRER